MLYLEQGEDHACTKLICHVDKTICLGNCFYFKQVVLKIVLSQTSCLGDWLYLKQVVLDIVLSQTSCLGDRFISNEFLKLFLSQAS